MWDFYLTEGKVEKTLWFHILFLASTCRGKDGAEQFKKGIYPSTHLKKGCGNYRELKQG